jgi:hypothetical protein
MKRPEPLLLVAALLGCVSCVTEPVKTGRPSSRAPMAPTPTATVEATKATFWFPVQDAGGLWRRNASRGTILEYAWVVRVTLEHTAYEMGFVYFADPRHPGQTGRLADLLKAGGQCVWRLESNGRAAIAQGQYRGISVVPLRRGLQIQVTEPELLQAFQADRPASVLFIERGSLLAPRPRQTEVTVHYVVTETSS